MRYLIFSLLIASVVIFSSCDEDQVANPKVYGTVVDAKTMEPISNAIITTNPPSESIQSNEKGEFIINIYEESAFIIYAQHYDYYMNYTSITTVDGKTINAVIALNKKSDLNTPPEEPVIILPMNQTIVNGNSVNISWTCTDSNGDILSYDLFMDESNHPATIIAKDLSKNSYNVTELIHGKRYYSKVIAKDIYGAISESQVITFTVDTTSPVNSDDLVAYFAFDGNTNNISQNTFNISANTISYGTDRNGQQSSAVYFNGTSSYILIDDNEALNFDDFTFAMWVNPSYGFGSGGSDDWRDILSRWSPQYSVAYYLVTFTSLGDLKSGTCNGYSLNYETANNRINKSQWTHVAVTLEGNILKFYINGEVAGSRSVVSPSGSTRTVSNDLYLGKRFDDFAFYGGYLDDLYIFKKALTPSEILALVAQ